MKSITLKLERTSNPRRCFECDIYDKCHSTREFCRLFGEPLYNNEGFAVVKIVNPI